MIKKTLLTVFHKQNLSYCREIELQGELEVARSERLELGDNYLRTL